MLLFICVMHLSMGSVVCKDGGQDLLDANVAECVKYSKDPVSTCNMLVTSDKKRWFFVYGAL